MLRRTLLRGGVTVAVALLALAALAPVGATAGPSAGSRAAADASPTASTLPSAIDCPDLAPGALTVETILSTGPAKMRECVSAAGMSEITFLAYFPAQECNGCGGTSGGGIDPGWLSGGSVDYDPATGAVTPAAGLGSFAMQVWTEELPYFLTDDEAAAWRKAHSLDLRLPPGLGTCVSTDTTPDMCTVWRYGDQVLRISAHYDDQAAQTCTGTYTDATNPDAPVAKDIPSAAAIGYCEQQLVISYFVTTTEYVCPAAPYTVLDFSHFTADRLLACLGSKKIVVTGYMPVPEAGGVGAMWMGKPGWLVNYGPTGQMIEGNALTGGNVWLNVRIPPNLGACDIMLSTPSQCPFTSLGGKTVRMVGRFDDPRSATCTASWTSPARKPAYFTRAYVRQYCRTQFVLLSKPVVAKTPK